MVVHAGHESCETQGSDAGVNDVSEEDRKKSPKTAKERKSPLGPKGPNNFWPVLYVLEGNGRHEETRTPDLYRVKVAL